MSTVEQILNFLSSLPPEFMIPISALAVVGYAILVNMSFRETSRQCRNKMVSDHRRSKVTN